MKTRLFISATILTLLMRSCGPGEDQAGEGAISPGTEAKAAPDFQKKYEGKIEGQYGISMDPGSKNGKLSGTYMYDSKGLPIELSGEIEADGSLSMQEFNAKGVQTGAFKGKLDADLTFDGIA